MSRIGKLHIVLPANVTFEVSKENVVKVKGPLGELSQKVHPSITVSQEENEVVVKRANDEKQVRSYHGLYRSLINNMVIGVSEGFKITQELVGVGYRASNQGQLLDLSLGFSHHVYFQIPDEVKVETVAAKGKNPLVILTSCDKQLVGQVAAKIRSLRKPEPYKGKGIRYQGEEIRRKAGKSAAAK